VPATGQHCRRLLPGFKRPAAAGEASLPDAGQAIQQAIGEATSDGPHSEQVDGQVEVRSGPSLA
jgi:hypothetical protein